MALSNAEKQARHRYYKAKAIEYYEKKTGITLKELMSLLRWYDEHGE